MSETEFKKYLEKGLDRIEKQIIEFRKEFEDHKNTSVNMAVDVAKLKSDCYGNGKEGYFSKIDKLVISLRDRTSISIKQMFIMIFGSSLSLTTIIGAFWLFIN